MADLPSVDSLYEGARGFAQSAMQAHYGQDPRRLALDAGTALEHLAKACLANRSLALLTELRTERNFTDLLQLLGLARTEGSRPLHTVGLRGALERVWVFVPPQAARSDLLTLVGMRDGTVHAAMNDEVGTRLLVVFTQFADSLLADLSRDRAEFWGGELAVVDALLADAKDKTVRDVRVKIAAAQAYLARHYGKERSELLKVVRELAEPDDFRDDQQVTACPACGSVGLATGSPEVDWEVDEWEDERPVGLRGTVWLFPARFECRVCKLRLGSAAEVQAAGIDHLQVDDVDPYAFETPDMEQFHGIRRPW